MARTKRRLRGRSALHCERLEPRRACAGIETPFVDAIGPPEVAAAVATESAEQQFGPLRYTVSEGNVFITGVDGTATSVVIPGAIDGLPVTGIGYYAFWRAANLRSVVIPGSVTMIGGYAFMESGIRGLVIPASVTSIGPEAFWDCDGLTSVTIPGSVVSLGRNAFEGCSNLVSVTIPATIGALDHGVFANCTSLRSVSIPRGIANVGAYAFSGCTSLAAVTIPDTVTGIGDGAFRDCTALASIALPGGVTSLGSEVFQGCTSLTSLAVPRGVTNLPSGAFSGCTALTGVSLPPTLRSIGAIAFYGCTALPRIRVPAGVTTIGDGPFMGCTSLATVDFLGDPPTIVDAFGDPAPAFDIGPGSPLVVRYSAGNAAWAAHAGATYGLHVKQAASGLAAYAAPTAIGLAGAAIAENVAAGSVVGLFSTTDSDAGDTFRYVIVPDARLDGTGLFEIVGNQLRTKVAFDFEAKSRYSIRVRSTDQGGLFAGRVFTIGVTDVNEAPTAVLLSALTVAENRPVGTVVGTLGTADPDAGGTFRYVIVPDAGLDGTGLFEVVGNQLRTRSVFVAAVKSTYSVRVRSIDQGGLFKGRIFTITVSGAV